MKLHDPLFNQRWIIINNTQNTKVFFPKLTGNGHGWIFYCYLCTEVKNYDTCMICSPLKHITSISTVLAPCNGKVCSNGGTLDPETCKCTCVPPYTPPTCDEGMINQNYHEYVKLGTF